MSVSACPCRRKPFNHDPMRYVSYPIMEFPVRSYIEFVVAQALLDRSGRFTTWDIELHCSFAPYRRALKKVNFEEHFHFRHGAHWSQYYWDLNDETAQRCRRPSTGSSLGRAVVRAAPTT